MHLHQRFMYSLLMQTTNCSTLMQALKFYQNLMTNAFHWKYKKFFSFKKMWNMHLILHLFTWEYSFLFPLNDIYLYKEQTNKQKNRIQLWRCLNCSLFYNFMFLIWMKLCKNGQRDFICFDKNETKQTNLFFMAVRIWWTNASHWIKPIYNVSTRHEWTEKKDEKKVVKTTKPTPEWTHTKRARKKESEKKRKETHT